MKEKQPAIEIKIIFLGDYGTGKTMLINSYVDGNIVNNPPITKDYRQKQVCIEDRDVKLKLWDPAGQEEYQNISKFFYRQVNACVFVYDLTNLESLENIPFWFEEFKRCSDLQKLENLPIVLVGNKFDEKHRRQVFPDQIQKIKTRIPSLVHFEASAKTSEGIYEFFSYLFENSQLLAERKYQTIGIKIKAKEERAKKSRQYKKCC